MLEFKRLTSKDIKLVQNFTKNSNYPLCDYSGGVIFTWYLNYNSSFAIFEDTLILKFGKKPNERFLLPLGKEVDKAINEIETYCLENEEELKFICVPDDSLEDLKARYNGNITCSFNRDYSDYIYDFEEMKTFSGKKFSGQRNHINAFKKMYSSYEYKKIENKDKRKIKAFLKEYDKQYPNKSKIEKKELEFTYKFVDMLSSSNLFGGYIEHKGEVVAMSIGEYAKNMLIIHVEKALLKYRGAYPLMYNEFVKNNSKEGVNFVNRQDDSGDAGLRISKTQYKPVKLSNKNYVIVKSAMPKFKKPILRGEKTLLSPIKKEDGKDYYKLNIAVKNNKYWGYDYKKDNKNPEIDYFYKVQKLDFLRGNNMCLAIRDKKAKKLIGEVILHKFSYLGRVEIGIRLIKKEQGKGYAKESLNLITSFVKEKLKLTPVMKCFKENLPSFNLITKCGYVKTGESEKFFYFKK